MQLFSWDRQFLHRVCLLAAAAHTPPKNLGRRLEPLWGALLACGEEEVASAIFLPGDPVDAVARLKTPAPAEATLYLTLEPNARFDRLPPVTESIRRLGVKRVVIGMLDPAQRIRGEGKSTLERMGIEVVVADGEEARLAQELLEDYEKWLNKGLAVLRARVELKTVPSGSLNLQVATEGKGKKADAVLYRAGKVAEAVGAWQVVLDPESKERPADNRILYQPTESAGVRALPFLNGEPDLGALLRDLASLGILSVELGADPLLFRQALRSGLVDSVLAQFPESAGGRALSLVEKVQLFEGGDPMDLRLGGARLLDGEKRYLEARVELC